MAQYSHFRRTGTNLKTAGVSPQVAWYRFATMVKRGGSGGGVGRGDVLEECL